MSNEEEAIRRLVKVVESLNESLFKTQNDLLTLKERVALLELKEAAR